MPVECKNCKGNIASQGDRLNLTRINALREIGEWICKDCLDELLERTEEGEPVYMHAPDCPNYCDYACNSKGTEIAEQIATYLKPLNEDLSHGSETNSKSK